jgi:hypothetical protein
LEEAEMAIEDDDIPYEIRERSQAAADALERRLLRAIESAEGELARVVRQGEADLDRLAVRIAETLAQLAVGSARTDQAGVPADFAAMIARAARRGARFT